MNKHGGFINIFLFIIIAFTVVLVSGVFIYTGNIALDELHDQLDNKTTVNGSANYSRQIDENIGDLNTAYIVLEWISFFIIISMIIATIIGSFMVSARPVFFVPYIFVMIAAIFSAAGIANAYEKLIEDATLGPTLAGFTGSNYIMLHLPIWVTIIGFIGAIIMYTRIQAGGSVGEGFK